MKLRHPQQDRSREKVRRIVAEGETWLLATPCRKIAMREVARRAGVSTGTLYAYFPDAEALLRAIETRAWGALRAKVFDDLANAPARAVPALVRHAIASAIGAIELFAAAREQPTTPDAVTRAQSLLVGVVCAARCNDEACPAQVDPSDELALQVVGSSVVLLTHLAVRTMRDAGARAAFLTELGEGAAHQVLERIA